MSPLWVGIALSEGGVGRIVLRRGMKNIAGLTETLQIWQ